MNPGRTRNAAVLAAEWPLRHRESRGSVVSTACERALGMFRGRPPALAPSSRRAAMTRGATKCSWGSAQVREKAQFGEENSRIFFGFLLAGLCWTRPGFERGVWISFSNNLDFLHPAGGTGPPVLAQATRR